MTESVYVKNTLSEIQQDGWWSGFKVGVVGGVFVTVAASLVATAMISAIEIPQTTPATHTPCQTTPTNPVSSPRAKLWYFKPENPG